jgi:hypothetical protein
MMSIDLRIKLLLPFQGEGFARKSECIPDGCAKQASNDAAVSLGLGSLVGLSRLKWHRGSIAILGFFYLGEKVTLRTKE